MRELAEGIHFTVVNSEVLLEKGTHTGNLPGRVIKNARHRSPDVSLRAGQEITLLP